jgi:hypothetical protein
MLWPPAAAVVSHLPPQGEKRMASQTRLFRRFATLVAAFLYLSSMIFFEKASRSPESRLVMMPRSVTTF